MRVMVVDDERISRVSTAQRLAEAGYEVESAESPFVAMEHLERGAWDVVITDLRMPTMDGLQFLAQLRQRWPGVDVIVMTAYGSVETAVEAMHGGAADYLTKPFPFRELDARLSKIAEVRAVRQELSRLRLAVSGGTAPGGLVGRSPGIRGVCDRIRLFAQHDAPVLVTGETGTGKELVARALHDGGTRRNGPFIPVSCGSIPRDLAESALLGHERGSFTGATGLRRGYFEQADRGTLLLDDVDDLSLETQVKLLRVLQEGRLFRVGGAAEIPVDVRVVATSKVDLEQAVAEGRFRSDIFYRLRGLEIRMPPLREREEDVLLLASHFLALHAAQKGADPLRLTPAVGELLVRYPWPGNVRELLRPIEAAVILCQGTEIRTEHLPDHIRRGATTVDALFTLHLGGRAQVSLQDALQQFEDALVEWAMRQAGGQQLKAAKLLGIPRTPLQSRLGRRTRG